MVFCVCVCTYVLEMHSIRKIPIFSIPNQREKERNRPQSHVVDVEPWPALRCFSRSLKWKIAEWSMLCVCLRAGLENRAHFGGPTAHTSIKSYYCVRHTPLSIYIYPPRSTLGAYCMHIYRKSSIRTSASLHIGLSGVLFSNTIYTSGLFFVK